MNWFKARVVSSFVFARSGVSGPWRILLAPGGLLFLCAFPISAMSPAMAAEGGLTDPTRGPAVVSSATVSVGEGITPSAADAGLLQVKALVEIDGSHDVMLDDLVEARGVSAEVSRALRDVRLSDAPRLGESRRFTERELSQILRTRLREILQRDGELPGFRIPSRVLVTRRTLKIRKEDVQNAILLKFKGQCADCEFEFTRFTMPILPATLDASESWSLQVRSELPKGSFSIPLEIKPNPSADEEMASAIKPADREAKTYWVNGQVAIRRRAAVAARAAIMGEKLAPEDFEMKLQDVTYSNDAPATASEITVSVLARGISAGEVIWRSQLRREQLIKTGDPVRVTAGSSEWQVTIEGVAQSGGYLGDSVRVKIPRTQKVVSGILREKGVVEIQ